MRVAHKKGETLVEHDEHPRDTTLEALARLKPVNGADKTAETVDMRLSGTLRIDILGVELQCYRTAGNGVLFHLYLTLLGSGLGNDIALVGRCNQCPYTVQALVPLHVDQ
mgnify:CR=1 FL=1